MDASFGIIKYIKYIKYAKYDWNIYDTRWMLLSQSQCLSTRF